MSGGVSYYGSKISLVSNAGIRYEGHLFSVDTADSTVTLSKVRSFGTEDRPCDHPVAQRDEMYDYIVFRASDIKDLMVCEAPKPPQTTSIAQDPAILQHSGAVSSTTTPSFRPPNTFASAPAPFAPFNQLPYQYGAIGGMMPNQFAAGQVQRPQIGVGRQTPPPNRKSPTMEQAVQASGPQSPDKDKNESSSKGRKDHDKNDHRDQEPQPQRRRGSREEQRRGGNNRDFRDVREEGRNRDNQDRYRDNQNRDHDRDGNRRRNDRGPRDQGRRPDNQQQQQQQPYRRGRGGRGRGHRPLMAKDPIKVGTDFDFDTANAQFDKEAIEDEFESKLKIVNGDEKSSEHEQEGSGSETPTSENQDDKAFYEPEKSFFDSISCESNNPDGNRTRPSRREEYKMNTETFGVPFSRGRGRGRGGFYRGGYNRGGYNSYQGGYNRSGGGYRGRNNYQRGGGGGTAWNNRRNRNQDWGRGDAPQRRDRGDDNRRREDGIGKGTTENSQKEDIKVAEGS
ncbi:protein LSM14 homolog A-like isoform X1 [Lytechinus variegatus]|uniref:protein LSM14 homolog A-like isoform X1 n=1 Tax=Lytechinus variegatus TaxID=7654 RepID=UPI001BB18582|nr:protein LSM14 homolog A-like isoform X1 [Lytechinus variegatus]XP_041454865.1 protein LSM14 homolog A-like isoform X1 [Lytechinus variegatus]